MDDEKDILMVEVSLHEGQLSFVETKLLKKAFLFSILHFTEKWGKVC